MSFLQTGEEEEGEGQEGARAQRARLGKLRTFDLILEAEGDGVRLTFQRNLSWRGPACSWGPEMGADARPAPCPRSQPPPPSGPGRRAPPHPVITNGNTGPRVSALQEPSKNRPGECNGFRGGVATGFRQPLPGSSSPARWGQEAGRARVTSIRKHLKIKNKNLPGQGCVSRVQGPSPRCPSHLE